MNDEMDGNELQVAQPGREVHPVDEVNELQRLEKAAGEIAQIEGLAPDKWAQLDETRREWCLRQVGDRLSAAYECPAPPFITSDMPEGLLGAHSDSEYMTKLNREILRIRDGDEALNTYCHEFRHAYQHEMAIRYDSIFKHLCHDEASAAKWSENLAPGHYISYEQDPEGYQNQPVEKDARDFADRILERVKTTRRSHE